MTVWVLTDAMNEEVVGVYSTRELAAAARDADPQSNGWLFIGEYELDSAVVRSQ